ncbi:MAG: fused MFS/spermidine synthase [Desulfomonile tiedjei]|nr:fused MFS/spermidine synthase [Desulfomonile tiedjei]
MDKAPRPAISNVLCLIFFVSGMSALIFENLWFRLARLTFGNSVWAGALVLSGFMAGLALGNGLAVLCRGSRIKFPIRLYAFLELLTAVTGLSLVVGLPVLTAWLSPLFSRFEESPALINPIRLGISFLLMLVPATAMGMTLPLLVKKLYEGSPCFGTVLGRLYGWNTLGALVGALLPDAVLVGAFGIKGSGVAAASLNLLAAAGAWYLSRTYEPRPAEEAGGLPKAPATVRFSTTAMRLLGAGFLSGGILLGLEVVWFRFLILFFNAYSIAFAIMLAVVLGAIGLGGIIASLWFRLRPEAHRYLVPVAFLAGATSIVAYALFGRLSGLLAEAPYQWTYMLCLSFPLMFPVSLLSGILFTLVGEAVHEQVGGSVETTGLLTMANTTGATLGSALAGFVLLPKIGMEQSFFWLTLGYAGVALLSLHGRHASSTRLARFASLTAAVAFGLSVWWFPFGSMQQHILSVGSKEAAGKSNWTCVAVRENLTETSQYWQERLLERPLYTRLFTNNHPMSSTRVATKRYMNFFVYWPVAVHPDPKDALLICFGVGATAKALTETKALKSIDVVDTSRSILADSALIFPEPKDNPLFDPRVKVHVEDGRFFLQTTNCRFDIITGEPPPPLSAGVVALYSQEYFQLIHDRLRDGGIVTYWLPVWQIPWSATKSILKAFSNVFEDCSLWNPMGFEWMMVGIRNPGARTSDEQFSAQWGDPAVSRQIAGVGFEVPEQIGATFLMDAEALREWTRDALPITDNYPARIFGQPEDSYLYTLSDLEEVAFGHQPAQRFLDSPLIRKLWPDSLRLRTMDYFPFQELINDALAHPGRPDSLPDMTALHTILTESSLRFPVFLLAGGPDMLDADRVVDTLNEKERLTTPGISFHYGVRALADRNFALAAKHFAAEQAKGFRANLVFYQVYSLCMAGEQQNAQVLLRNNTKLLVERFGGERVAWLRDTVGMAPARN